MKNNGLFGFGILLAATFLISCNPIGNTIDSKTIEKDLSEIKAKNPTLEPAKIALLEELVEFKEGREEYVKTRSHLAEVIIPSEEFDKAVSEFFDHCKANKISYEDLLTDYEGDKSIREKRQNELQEIANQIEKTCLELQKGWDEYERQLNSLVTVKLVDIITLQDKGKDVVQFNIKLINKISKPIYALIMAIDFYDKFGKRIKSIKLTGSGQINNSDIWYFPFYKDENEDIYSAFRGKSPKMFDIKIEIRKINLGGELMPEGEGEFYNYNIKPIEGFPSDICPYLPKDHELAIKKEKIEIEMTKEATEKFPAYTKLTELRGKTWGY